MSFYPGSYPWNPLMLANPTLSKMYPMVKSPEQMIAQLYCGINSLIDYTNQLSNYYIPQFKGEWNESDKYNPNDLVVDSDGNTWVALKPVPAGTPLEESEYWHVAYPYSKQFNDLQTLVNTFDNRITENTNDISTKAPIYHASEQQNFGIGTNLNYGHVKLADEITNTNSLSGVAATPLAVENAQTSKNYILMGDSYGAGIYPDGGGYSQSTYGWIKYCTNNKPAGVKNVYNSIDTISTGNQGFTASLTWLSVIQQLISDKTITDPASITDIYCLGGTNEVSNSSEIIEAIKTFCNYIKENFVNAKIHIGFLSTNYNGQFNTAKNAYINAATQNGCEYIKATEYLFSTNRKNYLATDNIHLTQPGYQNYADTIYNIIFFGLQKYSFIPSSPTTLYLNDSNKTQVSFTQFNTESGSYYKFEQPNYGNNVVLTFENFSEPTGRTILFENILYYMSSAAYNINYMFSALCLLDFNSNIFIGSTKVYYYDSNLYFDVPTFPTTDGTYGSSAKMYMILPDTFNFTN